MLSRPAAKPEPRRPVPTAVEATEATPRPPPITTKAASSGAPAASSAAPAPDGGEPARHRPARVDARRGERAGDHREVERREDEPVLAVRLEDREEHRRRRGRGQHERHQRSRGRGRGRAARRPGRAAPPPVAARARTRRAARRRRCSAIELGLAEPEQQRAEPQRQRDRSGHVEPAGLPRDSLSSGPASAAPASPTGTLTANTHSHPGTARDQPAEHPAGRAAAGRGRRPQPERARAPPGRLGRDEQRERRRRHERGADPLHRARRDQRRRGRRERAGERGGREQHQPGAEDPPPPVQVGHPAREQEAAAERQRVGAQYPVQPGRSEAEVAADRRQRDRHDRHVEDDDELGDAEECEPCVTCNHPLWW